ncbi:glucosamine--fructose-6-phosphate aminotransferase (isomerizing) [Strigomonas culicis]|uniref:Glucosamine--fructose-6-phosphate aminotransferase (Isomerizing) n=1 Tax=Strigomonas culicis TaxID=28005 RepID=S9TXC1_9TRYP|nr:glucosamine--fructose-6-phosphate aminotransferase (isomerizing) [Strigomonas culicis]|eukprot:EPY23102.1 glucosamine--fructose-6-phosphate aminotransferase (isomerizing) [Strigomonas culicis]
MSAFRPFEQLEITLESLTKGNYEHYMLKEICEQSETVVGSMRGRLDFARQQVLLGGFTPQNVRSVLHSQRLILISCGTSLNSCYAVRPVWDELLPVSVMVENASDFVDRLPRIYRNDTCVFVSQSGETADTLVALKHCRDSGALCVGLTNVVGSSVSRLTDFGCHLNAGQEVGVASTKAYTSQIVALLLIALMLSKDSVAAQERRREIITGLSELSSTITHVLAQVGPVVQEIAAELNQCHSLLVLGRGNDYATALEGALKIKELTYVHTEGINSGELKHGPLALVDEKIPVIALCSNDKHFLKSKTAIQQVHARKGRVTVITNVEGDQELQEAAARVLVVPATVDCLQCIVNVIPLQLLSYHLALLKGNNVDCPRNLAKSVTTQ